MRTLIEGLAGFLAGAALMAVLLFIYEKTGGQYSFATNFLAVPALLGALLFMGSAIVHRHWGWAMVFYGAIIQYLYWHWIPIAPAWAQKYPLVVLMLPMLVLLLWGAFFHPARAEKTQVKGGVLR